MSDMHMGEAFFASKHGVRERKVAAEPFEHLLSFMAERFVGKSFQMSPVL